MGELGEGKEELPDLEILLRLAVVKIESLRGVESDLVKMTAERDFQVRVAVDLLDDLQRMRELWKRTNDLYTANAKMVTKLSVEKQDLLNQCIAWKSLYEECRKTLDVTLSDRESLPLLEVDVPKG